MTTKDEPVLSDQLFNAAYTYAGDFLAAQGSEERDPSRGNILALTLAAAMCWVGARDATDFTMDVVGDEVRFGRVNRLVWTHEGGFRLASDRCEPAFVELFHRVVEGA